nr:hypothetical protein CFP56_56012 [Quercus suber]
MYLVRFVLQRDIEVTFLGGRQMPPTRIGVIDKTCCSTMLGLGLLDAFASQCSIGAEQCHGQHDAKSGTSTSGHRPRLRISDQPRPEIHDRVHPSAIGGLPAELGIPCSRCAVWPPTLYKSYRSPGAVGPACRAIGKNPTGRLEKRIVAGYVRAQLKSAIDSFALLLLIHQPAVTFSEITICTLPIELLLTEIITFPANNVLQQFPQTRLVYVRCVTMDPCRTRKPFRSELHRSMLRLVVSCRLDSQGRHVETMACCVRGQPCSALEQTRVESTTSCMNQSARSCYLGVLRRGARRTQDAS